MKRKVNQRTTGKGVSKRIVLSMFYASSMEGQDPVQVFIFILYMHTETIYGNKIIIINTKNEMIPVDINVTVRFMLGK